ncbi:YafY family protein [Anaerolentibacter hominis]|uniref:helix-turn-helix transcriptional regulator n=1 Tax=Anaerolentibacter hominis TaxID=3079009 RepID=UPI0031B879C6
MQINRLFEIVYILLREKTIKAKTLAERFEVSVRTIYRDIDILSSAGIPVYTSQGKGGGIGILDDFVLDKTALTQDEQDQILMGLQSMAAAGNLDTGRTLARLGDLFHKPEVSWIEVDFSRWGSSDADKEKFDLLRRAITGKQLIAFSYFSSYGNRTSRTCKPLKLIFKQHSWYLQGYCCEKETVRTFKINRILDLKLLPDYFNDDYIVPPVLDYMCDPPSFSTSLTIRFAPEAAYRIWDEFRGDQIEKQADGSFLVRTSMPADNWLFGFLLSFGITAEVLEPEHIRTALAGLAESIANQYKH